MAHRDISNRPLIGGILTLPQTDFSRRAARSTKFRRLGRCFLLRRPRWWVRIALIFAIGAVLTVASLIRVDHVVIIRYEAYEYGFPLPWLLYMVSNPLPLYRWVPTLAVPYDFLFWSGIAHASMLLQSNLKGAFIALRRQADNPWMKRKIRRRWNGRFVALSASVIGTISIWAVNFLFKCISVLTAVLSELVSWKLKKDGTLHRVF